VRTIRKPCALAGLRVAERPDALFGRDVVRWRIGNDRQAQHGHAAVAHRVGNQGQIRPFTVTAANNEPKLFITGNCA
jgi:hypothetical protein